MGIIDIHTHVFPDALAPRAMEHLASQADVTPCYDGTVQGLRAAMARAGIQTSVVQPIATKPSQVMSINDWALASTDRHTLFFGTIHPEYPDLAGELKRIADAGLPGVKIHGDYQRLFVDDEERAFPIYEILQTLGLMVLFHAGIDIGIPDPVHASPQRIARVHEAFPDLTLIVAHMGGFRQWDQVETFLIGKPLYLDTSFVMGHAPDALIVRMMRNHGYERILFASDGPWMDSRAQVAWVASLPIPEEAREQIFYHNARKLLAK